MDIITAIVPIGIDILPENLVYLLNSEGKHDYVCFLDSSLVPNKYSKFSYVCIKPRFVVRSDGTEGQFLNYSSKELRTFNVDPMQFLKEIFDTVIWRNNIKYFFGSEDESGSFKKDNLPDFTGGFAGYLSYDLKNHIEKLPQAAVEDVSLPLFEFACYDELLAYDISNKKWFYIKNLVTRPAKIKKRENKGAAVSDCFRDCLNGCYNGTKNPTYIDISNYEITGIINKEKTKLMMEIRRMSDRFVDKATTENIQGRIIRDCIKKGIRKIELHSNFTRNDYLEAVKKAKEYIHNGDIYQMNMTQRFKCILDIDPYSLYYILRQKNAAPFSAFLSFPGVKIGSSSPERFLFLKDGVIETRPVKGTRPRGDNEKQDIKYMSELQKSAKDHAELNMIVDLERNDLGRFCEYGTVMVKENAVIEKYARVFHLVSTITGKVRQGYGFGDIIRAMFPGGSITGAPKIRAMQIIDELEPNTRNIYTGAIGFAGFNGTADFNIVIRTFIIKGREFYYNVGGGIVEDSVPEDEYSETLDKGQALLESLKFFELDNLLKIKKKT